MVSTAEDSETATPPSPPEDEDRVSSVRIALRALDHRARLAALEFREARSELLRFGAMVVVAIASLQLAAVTGLAAIVAWSWDTEWRVWAPVLAGGVLLLIGVVTLLLIRHRAGRWMPFGDVLGQISRDARSLRAMFNPPPREKEEHHG